MQNAGPPPVSTFLISLFSALLGAGLATGLLAGRSDHPLPPQASPSAASSSPSRGEMSPEHDPKTADGVQDAVVRAARVIGPSVVNIDTAVAADGDVAGHGGEGPMARGQGSGVIVSADGYILTNHHVVDGARDIEVTLPEPDGRKLRGVVKGADRPSDLAIVKVDARDLPAAHLGDSNAPPVGSLVLAVGNPLGFQHTVTLGVLSGRGREIPEPGKELRNLLQTDAAINPGNSGGPLVDLEGRVIGINTAIIPQAQGLGFAIPMSTARHVMDQLLTKGRVIRAYIGVVMMPLTPRLRGALRLSEEVEGAVVRQVLAASPAAEAGVAPGDIICAVDGLPTPTLTKVQAAIRTHAPGELVTLTLLHRSTRREIRVRVVEMPPLEP